MIKKKWILAKQEYSDIVDQLLYNRGIPFDQKEDFLNPDYRNLIDPFQLKDIKKAVNRVIQALRTKEKIAIFGDYDVDGTTGATIIFQVLKSIGLSPQVYLPSREEGYGLGKIHLQEIVKKGSTLLITIDTGISNWREIEWAQKNNLDVIIIDHHQIPSKLPSAQAIIDPYQKDCHYPFPHLAAAALAWKFGQAIFLSLKLSPQIIDLRLKWLLDLVGLATICDIVPLISENRIFAKFGLMVLAKTKRIGLQKLFQVAGIDPNHISPYTVGFLIGPRLNAPGRMDHANQTFYLLNTHSIGEAESLAKSLDLINRQRQEKLDQVLKEARTQVLLKKLNHQPIIIVSGKDWPAGIVGLVAGKLVEEFARPAIVFEERAMDLRGSARSIDQFHLIDALEECHEYLARYGGHARAAGVSMKIEHLAALYDRLIGIASAKLKDKDLTPKLKIDFPLELTQIDQKLFKIVQLMEPYGLGNPKPIFQTNRVKIKSSRLIGKDNRHIKMWVKPWDQDRPAWEAIGFDLGRAFSSINSAEPLDLVYYLDQNNFGGQEKIQLKIIDFRQGE